MKYLLDSNVFFTAHRHYYSFDLCPAFWNFLAQNNEWFIIENVFDEMTVQDKKAEDFASRWIKKEKSKGKIVPTTGSNIERIIEAVEKQGYTEKAIKGYVEDGGADIFLIDYCLNNPEVTLVSLEVSEPHKKGRIKIPDVCKIFGIRYIDSFTFLKETKACFNSTVKTEIEEEEEITEAQEQIREILAEANKAYKRTGDASSMTDAEYDHMLSLVENEDE